MKTTVQQIGAALFCGALFGFGLSLSGMLDPARVQGFLDIFGAWDPSLIFVLGGAVTVAFAGMGLVRRMGHPVFADSFQLPTKTKVDMPLILGSALFGIGWGLGGFCPGPALASLSLGYGTVAIFVVTMAVGMILHDRLLAGRLS
ncbi:YeeE/YedE family protein [Rhizobium oryzicola]|uniref:YeeE/YedE family protein n=1 Tax=Rhizobium oryzicola TaxID=1232668 RepID=A0ABT8STR7_9HYPH|nr:YeeE/YedE family protein [Rhizobium oryzicola]MDO1581731.1 YeeE/YedE family protein [Rhizobium oryzicola]